MIKANELRIGNFLQGEPFQNRFGKSDGIIQITAYGIYLMSPNEVDLKLNPIPLTEEWIKKLGFEFYVPLCHYKLCNNDIWVSITKEFIFSFCNLNYDERVEMPPKKVRYVHQLQNLYFALTGEELVLSSTET